MDGSEITWTLVITHVIIHEGHRPVELQKHLSYEDRLKELFSLEKSREGFGETSLWPFNT